MSSFSPTGAASSEWISSRPAGLLGGGRRDAHWDRSGMTHHRLAILPGLTHYDINLSPALSQTVIPFLD